MYRSEDERNWVESLGDVWCGLMHTSPMWPIHGQYECGVCGRRYLVPWGADDKVQAREPAFAPALGSLRN
jgi:hypothetical protein